MKVIGLLTLVYILGGPEPGVDVAANRFMPLEECRVEAAAWSKLPPTKQFTEDGRPILAVYADCAALEADDVAEQLRTKFGVD